MSTFSFNGTLVVRAYLGGRVMDDLLFDAVVWMADHRLACGLEPVLDQRLCMDIDSQAQAPADGSCRPPVTAPRPAVP